MRKTTILFGLLLLAWAVSANGIKTTLFSPKGVNTEVYAGFAPSNNALKPIFETQNGSQTQRVYNLEPGNYHFLSKGYGYLSLKKNFVVTKKPLKINADPGRKEEKGYQQSILTSAYTDQVIEKCLCVENLQKLFPKVLTSPGFRAGKSPVEHTTQREMEDFLLKLNASNERMYLYDAGYSTEGMKIPLVVFSTSNLKGLSLEQAGECLSKEHRPMVFLHAEIHGNENSPGEAALSMCAQLCATYGKQILDKVNVIIMPRVNPDGTKAWIRGTSVMHDLNRDNLLVKNPEVKATHRVYNAFQPHLVIDMHEYSVRNYADEEGFLDDAGITIGGNQNNSHNFNELQKEMMHYVEKRGVDVGLRYWEYTQAGYSDQSPLHASHYFSLRSSASFLVETPNYRCQRSSSFKRRVFTHFYAVHALIEYAINNTEKLLSMCNSDKEYIIKDRSKFVLRHGQNKEAYTYSRTIFSLVDGSKLKDTLYSVRYYEVPLIVRERPKAYVIPATTKNIERILEIAQYNGIKYTLLPNGSEMTLRQYAQNPKWKPAVQPIVKPGEKAKFVYDDTHRCLMLEKQKTIFEKGAYLFPVSQPSAIVLMFLMEPDVIKTDVNPITLVQAGLLDLDELYREEF
ncbi:MAG: hypothetical protein KBS95_05755 [Alistipes sp.]|nr:hypothetical protein [Candidatus Alistipes equi]